MQSTGYINMHCKIHHPVLSQSNCPFEKAPELLLQNHLGVVSGVIPAAGNPKLDYGRGHSPDTSVLTVPPALIYLPSLHPCLYLIAVINFPSHCVLLNKAQDAFRWFRKPNTSITQTPARQDVDGAVMLFFRFTEINGVKVSKCRQLITVKSSLLS